MNKKSLFALGLLVSFTGLSAIAQATPWQSSRTTIEDLDNVCWGDRQLNDAKTEFQGRPYSGMINFDRAKTGGCVSGDLFTGKFTVAGAYNSQCEGKITVEFAEANVANITWDILNAKNQAACPVRHTLWQTQVIRTDSEAAIGATLTVATVNDAPARIRTAPNGALMCAIAVGQTVNILGAPDDGWYRTDACGGTLGYVHDDYLVFFER
ncbi:MAG: SH3 domain-containing protein [Limnothrix sp.]